MRSVPGIAWAVNLYRGQAQAQLENGDYQAVILLGLDDASLVGARPKCSWAACDLANPDAVLVDEAGFH